jgi:thiamine-phosphate pyrophosphorylase
MADRSPAERRRERLSAARLYLIVESRPRGAPADELVAAALAGGVDLVQLRDKRAREEALLAAGRRLRDLCAARGALFVVNDRPDLALACGADGVHVGQGDERVGRVRELVGPELLIGLSTHSNEQIAAANESDADYIGVGPVYATPTKPAERPVGLELVRHATESARAPFFAIGGIDACNVEAVAAAGAERIAVVRAIRDAPDPRAAAAALREALVDRLKEARVA